MIQIFQEFFSAFFTQKKSMVNFQDQKHLKPMVVSEESATYNSPPQPAWNHWDDHRQLPPSPDRSPRFVPRDEVLMKSKPYVVEHLKRECLKRQSVHQSINQSSKQASKQSIKQSINQSINQSSKQASKQSIHQ